jgi:hypothetical protein
MQGWHQWEWGSVGERGQEDEYSTKNVYIYM